MRTIYFYWTATNEGFTADCDAFDTQISVKVDYFDELNEACQNATISHCESLYDLLALPDNNIIENDEQIASDVLQGMFNVILKKKKI